MSSLTEATRLLTEEVAELKGAVLSLEVLVKELMAIVVQNVDDNERFRQLTTGRLYDLEKKTGISSGRADSAGAKKT